MPPLDLCEQQRTLLAPGDQTGRRRVENEICAFDFGRERRDACKLGCASRAAERRARDFRPQAPKCDACDHELVDDLRGRRERRSAEPGHRELGLVEAPDEKKAASLDVTCMGGIDEIATTFERGPRRRERLRRPVQVAQDERDLGFGNDASCARDGLFRTEGACGAPQQRLGPREIAELRHCDAA